MDTDRILIVEDERIIAIDLQRRLERCGYQVVGLATSAASAVEAASELKPDIILMDIMLSGEVDGIDAATTIRTSSQIPVVFLTAFADERTLERAKLAEPYGYLLKPFKERELYTTIDMALHKSRLHREVKQHERRLAAILNSVADGIIATDKNDTIAFLNPVAETLTGWADDEAHGLLLTDVFSLFDSTSGLRVQLPATKVGRDENLYFQDVHIKNKQGARIQIEGTISSIRSQEDNLEGKTIAFRDVTDLKKTSDIIVYQASHDILTGLINRDEFFARLESTVSSGNSTDKHAFLYIDLDQFKVVNDVCGHLAGDELLRQIAAAIQDVVQRAHFVGRLGGDEFGLVLVDTDLAQALDESANLLSVLNRKFIWHQNTFTITASIGLVPVIPNGSDIYELLAAADDACYLAKEEGGNCVKLYETADYSFLKRRGEMKWISRLTHALEQDRFLLYSQPIIAVTAGLPNKQEILIRLVDDDGSLVGPGDFIPAAERYNLMPVIDRWVINAVIGYLKSGVLAPPPGEMICINISGASVKDEVFLNYVISAFHEAQVDPSIFCFEVTETTAIESLSRAVGFMNRLRKIGVSFALDDFGNGFTSFAYLKNLPVDYLKIDGSFVRDVDTDPISLAMVEAIHRIGHVMGMKTIAEFVTSPSVKQKLAGIGVDYVQGYEIARPAPVVALKHALQ
jgi:diguanylate cyclase (GGDEF)-like protein/PAS domain S-box-containing protein